MPIVKIILSLFVFALLASLTHADTSPAKSGTIEAQHDGKKIDFPLLKAYYQVNIQGDLATVTLTQTFKNPTQVPLNATYLFPLNKEAAVYAMQMQVGDEIVTAKMQRIEEAKKTFNEAKKAGKAASLLEQHRTNMFTQNLANLMPALPIKITLKYTQAIPRIDKAYELVLPLVVGPRYESASTQTAKTQTTNSKTQFGAWELESLPKAAPVAGIDVPKTLIEDRVSIEVNLNAGMPIQSVSSDTHTLTIDKPQANQHAISLAKGKTLDNRDFVLHYQLAGKTVQAAFLNHEDKRGKFFSLLIEPPALPQAQQINAREIVFVLDTSGSMTGLPLQASQTFMQHALKSLRPTDYFRIISFGSSPREYSAQPLLANTENLAKGQQYIQALQAGGGTEVVKAINQALKTKPVQNTLRIVVFLTDGYIGDEFSVLKRINELKQDARIYAFGVGSSVNRFLLDEMANAGRGFARYINPTEKVEDVAIKLANRLSTPVLTDIEIDWGKLKVQQVTPQPLPDLFVGDSLRLLGQYTNLADGKITIKGKINGQLASLPIQLSPASNNAASEAIPLLWARSQIKDAMRLFSQPEHIRTQLDMNSDQLKQQIIHLGLQFSLMTRWTAFVAVSNKVVNEHQVPAQERHVPVPMVKGVSHQAYPSSSSNIFAGSSAPEPAVVTGLAFMSLLFSGLAFRRLRKGKV